MRTDVRRRLGAPWDQTRDPVVWATTIRVVKTAVAAVLAWVAATHLLHLPQAFLAPWSALLVVHATVYRTFSEGARQVGAAVVAVLVAWAVDHVLGPGPLSVGVAVAAGLALGVRWLAGQGTTMAATALIVLTTGFADNDNVLVLRLADTAIGIATGLLVNLVVWPPLHARTAASAIESLGVRVGRLLEEMGEGLGAGCSATDVDDWIEQTRELDGEVDRAWGLLRHARESALMNPRRSAADFRDPYLWRGLLEHVEQAVAETRSMAHTLARGTNDGGQWESGFREAYVVLLRDLGHAIADADPMTILAVRERLRGLVDTLGAREPAPPLWPVYGGLIINLRNIVDAMDEVAKGQPIDQPPLPFARPRE